MKLLLIKASAPSDFKDYKAKRGSPSQNIFSTAAAVQDRVDLEIIDETAGHKVNYKTDADIVGIFFSTPDALQGYEIATKFQEQGKTVFLGGLHVTALPNEALQYAPTVLLGESEGAIDELLNDYEKTGHLKPKYQRNTPFDLKALKPYPTHLVPAEDYGHCWTVLVSRGCPYKCHFCVVPNMLGKIRYRDIDAIVSEIVNSQAQYFELHADNLTVDKQWCKALFDAITPLGINWSVATDISIAEDDEFLEAAAKSGLNYVLVGLETPSQEALKGTGKGFVKVDEIKKRVEKLHKHGIAVDAAMLFGFDEHDETIFQRSLDFALDIKLDVCEPVIQIPFPGTKLYNDLETQGRILTKDWSQYDGSHVVYEPKNLTPEQIYEGVDYFYRGFNSITNTTLRKARQVKDFGSFAFYL